MKYETMELIVRRDLRPIDEIALVGIDLTF